MLAMIAFPKVQKKCQEELDRIVGRSRMPTFKDRENLPYLRATLREVFRWRTVTPIGETLFSIISPIVFTLRLVGRHTALYHGGFFASSRFSGCISDVPERF